MNALPQFVAWSALYAELNYKFRNSRSFLYLFLDLLFGLFSASLLMRRWADVSGHFWSALYLSIERLEQLITWLTNNPAGLKLNTALNTFLSNFFFYHIHLWKTYVAALEQFPTHWLLLASGAFGLTVLLAFVADFLRVLTIHIFFFHVYTHRSDLIPLP